jgi:hypothetical protein
VLHHPASRSPATSADIEIETYVLRCEHDLLIYMDTANAIYFFHIYSYMSINYIYIYYSICIIYTPRKGHCHDAWCNSEISICYVCLGHADVSSGRPAQAWQAWHLGVLGVLLLSSRSFQTLMSSNSLSFNFRCDVNEAGSDQALFSRHILPGGKLRGRLSL